MMQTAMLTGKIALVTGASRGIGRAIALRLAQEGADVVVNYLRKGSAAREVVAAIEALGRRAVAVKANVSEADDLQRLMDEVTAFGGLDIVIANAASGVMLPVLSITAKHWHHTLNTNALAFVLLAQQAAPLLAARGGGVILTLSSPGARAVHTGYGLVGASKAALEALVRNLAVELAPQGIVVNAICPGLVDTDAAQFLPEAGEFLAEVGRATPAGRLATPDDVADVVSWLCSPGARMIRGQTIIVDGGYELLYQP